MHIDERETVVRIGYGPDATVSVWTTERAIMGKCKRAGWRLEQESVNRRGTIVGQEWVSSANDLKISVKKPGRPKVKTGFLVSGQVARKNTRKHGEQ